MPLLLGAARLWVAPAFAEVPPTFATVSSESMATLVTVVLPGDRLDLASLAFEEFRAVEATANEWKPEATIALLNRNGTARLDPELCGLLRQGLGLGSATHGAFDVTWAALWDLWDFEHPEVPDASAVVERLPHVGHAKVVLSDDCVATVPPGTVVGLGGIAKGHALDRAVARIRAAGLHDFSVSAGGQVFASGLKDGRPWRIGVRDPRGDRDDAFAIVEASDVSVSTSGDYERYFEVDGVRYHHIVDPRTGWPSRGLRSASVVCADATLADALSTAVMVLGKDEGLEVVGEQGCEAVVVRDDASVHATPALADRLVVVHPPRP